jgi:hypothetical protein
MVQFKKKNAGDVYPSSRLFDAEMGHFTPTLWAARQFLSTALKIPHWVPPKSIIFALWEQNCSAAQPRS